MEKIKTDCEWRIFSRCTNRDVAPLICHQIYKTAREDDLREAFAVPHYNILKSIISVALCESYFYFLLIEAPTSRY